MKDDPVTHARRHLDAATEVHGWTEGTFHSVHAQKPFWVRSDALAWAVAVEVYRKPRESPEAASQRLALYLTLHRERYGQAPSLKTNTNDHDQSPEQD